MGRVSTCKGSITECFGGTLFRAPDTVHPIAVSIIMPLRVVVVTVKCSWLRRANKKRLRVGKSSFDSLICHDLTRPPLLHRLLRRIERLH
ncbi:Vesicle-associated protein 2-2 isoform H [Glycine soja]|uniref:Vesicle-associated protein 2-2 isoform G n=1 Tax=Glycine soja TaxID=3848 RepID=A0A445F986_GLYSO|nr:Vesicle-associated protein 2-2 isoform G [Glycine soja]RZB45370.1 Vesicle-associated protein 2-2 isoform H [Glycine soja]